MDTDKRRLVFPDGHSSKDWPRSALLNCSERVTELTLAATIEPQT